MNCAFEQHFYPFDLHGVLTSGPEEGEVTERARENSRRSLLTPLDVHFKFAADRGDCRRPEDRRSEHCSLGKSHHLKVYQAVYLLDKKSIQAAKSGSFAPSTCRRTELCAQSKQVLFLFC